MESDAGVQSPWLNYVDAAAYLGVAVGTVRNWVSARSIPFVRRGGVVRFHRADLDAWLRQEDGCSESP